MKKLVYLSVIVLMASCGNNSTSKGEAVPNPANVQNVNGNVPDTVNSTNLNNGNLPVDSSRLKDSARH